MVPFSSAVWYTVIMGSSLSYGLPLFGLLLLFILWRWAALFRPRRQKARFAMKEKLIQIRDNRKYLRMLSQKYPSIQDVAARIVNLASYDALPKGTEHFISDLHGEADAFIHILNNASGVIREKVDNLFDHTIPLNERDSLATLVYYPKQKLELVKRQNTNMPDWYRITIQRLVELARLLSSKYSRKITRDRMPIGYEYIIDELLHTNYDEQNKEKYYDTIIQTMIQLDMADDLIVALSSLIKSLAVDRLHILGDIFDRGPRPDIIMEKLMEHHSVDIQWGNHDILWMGAAAGSRACIANVLNNCLQYDNVDLIEDVYGINLRELALFAQETYGDCPVFTPKVVNTSKHGSKEVRLYAQMKKAIDVIMLKLEGRIILRHPEYHMEDRLLLDKINYEAKTVTIGGVAYPMRDCSFPTVNPQDPYNLTPEEEQVMENIKQGFKRCEKLQRHVSFLYSKGEMFTCCNGNLLFHGCVPMEKDGSFSRIELDGQTYFGRELMNHCETLARQAYFAPTNTQVRAHAKDFMWYLWCGKNSPLFGRNVMTTFERLFIEDKTTWAEPKNPYYDHVNQEKMCLNVLAEFGLSSSHSHIVNGHVPVKAKNGESPIKGNGRLVVIDGGFCRAYHNTTGIAGYTLISNSNDMRIVAHEPFTTIEDAVENNTDIHSTSNIFEFLEKRMMVADTDSGEVHREKIEDLKMLMNAYRMGIIKQTHTKENLFL